MWMVKKSRQDLSTESLFTFRTMMLRICFSRRYDSATENRQYQTRKNSSIEFHRNNSCRQWWHKILCNTLYI